MILPHAAVIASPVSFVLTGLIRFLLGGPQTLSHRFQHRLPLFSVSRRHALKQPLHFFERELFHVGAAPQTKINFAAAITNTNASNRRNV